MSSNYKNLLKQLKNLERLEKASKTPGTRKISGNLRKAMKEAERRPVGFSLLTNEERNAWQMIYNETGTNGFKEMNIKVQIDPSTRYSKNPKVSTVQDPNARAKYRAYIASFGTENDTSTVASDPRPASPASPASPATPPLKPKLTNFIQENYFKGGRKQTRKHPKRLGCRFTRKH